MPFVVLDSYRDQSPSRNTCRCAICHQPEWVGIVRAGNGLRLTKRASRNYLAQVIDIGHRLVGNGHTRLQLDMMHYYPSIEPFQAVCGSDSANASPFYSVYHCSSRLLTAQVILTGYCMHVVCDAAGQQSGDFDWLFQRRSRSGGVRLTFPVQRLTRTTRLLLSAPTSGILPSHFNAKANPIPR